MSYTTCTAKGISTPTPIDSEPIILYSKGQVRGRSIFNMFCAEVYQIHKGKQCEKDEIQQLKRELLQICKPEMN